MTQSTYLYIVLILNSTPSETTERNILHYKKANWKKFTSYLNDNISINSKIYNKSLIDKTAMKLTNTINEAIKISIPTKATPPHSHLLKTSKP